MTASNDSVEAARKRIEEATTAFRRVQRHSNKITTTDIERFKEKYPERYAALQKQVHAEIARDEAAEVARLKELEVVRVRDLQLAATRKTVEQQFRYSLATTEAPSLDLRNIQGLIALRSWRLSPSGLLQSTALKTCWDTVTIADTVPTEENSHGLHCFLILPEYITDIIQYSSQAVHGLIEVHGKVIEHTDGVLRAEWAKIHHLFVNADAPGLKVSVYNTTKRVHYNYPHLPIDVLNKKQLSTVLFKVALLQYTRLRGT